MYRQSLFYLLNSNALATFKRHGNGIVGFSMAGMPDILTWYNCPWMHCRGMYVQFRESVWAFGGGRIKTETKQMYSFRQRSSMIRSHCIETALPRIQQRRKLCVIVQYRRIWRKLHPFTYRKFLKKGLSSSKPSHHERAIVCLVWFVPTYFRISEAKVDNSSILAHPDFKLTFIPDTDACDVSTRAPLSQVHKGEDKHICYGTKPDQTPKGKAPHGQGFLIRTLHSALPW